METDFRGRLNEVSLYIRSLADVEKRQLGGDKLFYRAQPALAASRASSFIMIYNCVEYGVRQSLKNIRDDAAINVTRFEELIDYWQHEIILTIYSKKLKDGTNFDIFLGDLRKSLPPNPKTLRNARQLPFSGNINHEKLIELAHKIGVRGWKPPKLSLGGSDLELVRKARNDLAHGEETFENIGGQYSCADIQEKLRRIRLFTCSYLRKLESYKTKRHYKR